MNIKPTRAQKIPIQKPGDIFKILRQILRAEEPTDQDKEHFFRIAVMRNVPRLILAHNHPSGVLKPSLEDLRISQRLLQSGRILGIEALDHLIISKRSCLSLADKGFL